MFGLRTSPASSRRLLSKYTQRQPLSVAADAHRVALYRPFLRQHVYFSSDLNEDRRRLPEAFPTPAHANHGVLLTGVSSHYEFCAIATDAIPDLHLLDTGQFFARWRYEPIAEPDDGTLDFGTTEETGETVDGYRRIDNITDAARQRFQATYPSLDITKDDVFHYVYGVLHSPTYREAYAADLKKSLPRIPLVADFAGFAAAGRDLYQLHRSYETAQPYPLDGLNTSPVGNPYEFYAVGEKKMRYVGSGADKDHSSIRFNDRITLAGIPEEAHRYRLGSRSAVDWIIDRYHVKTDKNSGIVNDPNAWSREVGDPRYILDLLARVVTVSLETMTIVDSLPPLDIRDQQ
jgi:predicted helicase